MHRSFLHNVLTPVANNGAFPDQETAHVPVIPQGHGDERTLETHVDLACVWKDWMARCSRRIVSPNLGEITIRDHAVLRRAGARCFSSARVSWI